MPTAILSPIHHAWAMFSRPSPGKFKVTSLAWAMVLLDLKILANALRRGS